MPHASPIAWCATADPWRHTVAECLRRPGSLRRWERGFLESLTRFPRLSPKQGRILNEIADRVSTSAAA
jgi:hypothetical protein